MRPAISNPLRGVCGLPLTRTFVYTLLVINFGKLTEEHMIADYPPAGGWKFRGVIRKPPKNPVDPVGQKLSKKESIPK
jgi:hypothetical protein